MGPISGMGLEPEQLGQVFSAVAGPAAALAFEAPVDTHFDVLFNCPAARAHRSKTATKPAAQPGRDNMPVIQPVAVTQDVAKEALNSSGRVCRYRLVPSASQERFAVALPYGCHNAAIFALIIAHQRANILSDVPAIQQPMALGQILSPLPISVLRLHHLRAPLKSRAENDASAAKPAAARR